MNIEYLSPADLIPYNKNAKRHPADQVRLIANSIKQFGFQQPIVVDKDNVVVIGHGRLLAAETYEERQARIAAEKEQKAQEQRDSLTGQDFIWRMPYKQYKEHYSDCETVAGSFARMANHPCTIEVIVREGRLKASGVRGEHYSGYRLQNEAGEQVVYRGVKEENAIRRAEKDFGGTWECIRIYDYNGER